MDLMRFACALALLSSPAPADDTGSSAALSLRNRAAIEKVAAHKHSPKISANHSSVGGTASRAHPPRRSPRRRTPLFLVAAPCSCIRLSLVPHFAESPVIPRPVFLGSPLYLFMALLL